MSTHDTGADRAYRKAVLAALGVAQRAEGGAAPSVLSDLYGEGYANPDLVDYRMKGRGGTPSLDMVPRGAAAVLPSIVKGSQGAVETVNDIADRYSRTSGQAFINKLLSGVVPSTVNAVARLFQAPVNYVQDRDLDLVPSDALLALPLAGPVGRRTAEVVSKIPGVSVSPGITTPALTGAGAFGVGVAEANSGGPAERKGAPRLRTREEFERDFDARTPLPKLRTIDEAASAAEEAYRRSPDAQRLIEMKALSRVAQNAAARAAEARKTYPQEEAAYNRRLAERAAERDRAWQAEQDAHKESLAAYNNLPFYQRESWSPYVMGGFYAAPAILGGGLVARKNMTGHDVYNRATNKALPVSDRALAVEEAKAFLNPSKMDRAKSFAGHGIAMLGPAEARLFGDVYDAYAGPAGAAQEKASKNLTAENALPYMAGMAPAALTGLAMYGIGTKSAEIATGNPKNRLKAVTSDTLPDTEARIAARDIAQAKRDRDGIVREGRDDRLRAESQGRVDEAEARNEMMRKVYELQRGSLAPPISPVPVPPPILPQGVGMPPASGRSSAGRQDIPRGSQEARSSPRPDPDDLAMPPAAPVPPPPLAREKQAPQSVSDDTAPRYTNSQKNVVRPFIASEVAAGRTVPDLATVNKRLADEGLKVVSSPKMSGKLDYARSQIDDLLALGMTPDQAAAFLTRRMGKDSRLPAIGFGAGAAGLGWPGGDASAAMPDPMAIPGRPKKAAAFDPTAERYRSKDGRFVGSLPEQYRNGGAITNGLHLARQYANGGPVHAGPVTGPSDGRADDVPINVEAGAYVIPADCVAALGEGNSEAGMTKLQHAFGAPRKRASGGAVPIAISHGEYVVSPDQVERLGGGDMQRGHAVLDNAVKKIRAENIARLKAMPGPAK